MVKRLCDELGMPELTTIRLGLDACSYKLNSDSPKLKMEGEGERVTSRIVLPKLSEFVTKTGESDSSPYPAQTVIASALLMERMIDRHPVQCSRCFSFSQL